MILLNGRIFSIQDKIQNCGIFVRYLISQRYFKIRNGFQNRF
nr:MAG TPA: hypothetical protein [Caudoviricetes sp.]